MDNSIWLLDSPVTMLEGEEIAFSVDWQGATVVSDAAVTVYKNAADITDEAMGGADAHLINGNVLTMKKLTAGATDGGSRYVLLIEAMVDGNRERRKLLVQIVRADAEV
jgi:hypothetical protein